VQEHTQAIQAMPDIDVDVDAADEASTLGVAVNFG
jgi:hypothetical protein